jgi:hypothetical protein
MTIAVVTTGVLATTTIAMIMKMMKLILIYK